MACTLDFMRRDYVQGRGHGRSFYMSSVTLRVRRDFVVERAGKGWVGVPKKGWLVLWCWEEPFTLVVVQDHKTSTTTRAEKAGFAALEFLHGHVDLQEEIDKGLAQQKRELSYRGLSEVAKNRVLEACGG